MIRVLIMHKKYRPLVIISDIFCIDSDNEQKISLKDDRLYACSLLRDHYYDNYREMIYDITFAHNCSTYYHDQIVELYELLAFDRYP